MEASRPFGMRGCRPLTDEEVTRIVDEIGRGRFGLRNRALFLLGVRAGYRISELLSLTVGGVYQNGNFVSRVVVERQYMKGKKDSRSIALHPQAREAIVSLVRELEAKGLADPAAPLFRSREGESKPIDRRQAWRILTRAARVLGMTGKLGTHCMRKTFAKRVHDILGRDLMKTQKALGHRRLTSTASYLSFTETEIDDAILKS